MVPFSGRGCIASAKEGAALCRFDMDIRAFGKSTMGLKTVKYGPMNV